MKVLFNFITISGLVLMVGTAGGCDCGNFTFEESVMYCIAALVLILVGISGRKKCNKKKSGEIVYVEKFGTKAENTLSA